MLQLDPCLDDASMCGPKQGMLILNFLLNPMYVIFLTLDDAAFGDPSKGKLPQHVSRGHHNT